MRIKAAVIHCCLHWGFSVRAFPGSAVQPSFLIPPPSTIIGALTKGIMWNVSKELFFVSDGIVSPIYRFIEDYWPFYITVLVDTDLAPARTKIAIRYMTGIYQAKLTVEQWAKSLMPAQFFAPVQVGYTVIPGSSLYIIYIGDKLPPKTALWSLNRLGSKESMVSVIDVYTYEVEATEIKKDDKVEVVNTCTPSFLIKDITEGMYIVEEIPFPLSKDEWLLHARVIPCPSHRVMLRPIHIPLNPSKGLVDVTVRDDVYEVELDMGHKVLHIIMPRSIMVG